MNNKEKHEQDSINNVELGSNVQSCIKGVVKSVEQIIAVINTEFGVTYLDIQNEWLPKLKEGDLIEVNNGKIYINNGKIVTIPNQLIVINEEIFSKNKYFEKIEKERQILKKREEDKKLAQKLFEEHKKGFDEQLIKYKHIWERYIGHERWRKENFCLTEEFISETINKFNSIKEKVLNKAINDFNYCNILPVVPEELLSLEDQLESCEDFMIWTEMNIKDNKNVIDVPKDIYYIFDIQHHDSKDFLEISNNLNKNNRRFLTTAEVLASICHGHIANDIKILGSVCNGNSTPMLSNYNKCEWDDYNKRYREFNGLLLWSMDYTKYIFLTCSKEISTII